MANVPAELKYTREHEWAKVEGDRVRIGITAFAQEQLGDVVFVELPKVGAKVTAHADLRRGRVGQGGVRSLRAGLGRGGRGQRASSPKKPEIVNSDPYGKGWMLVVTAGQSQGRGRPPERRGLREAHRGRWALSMRYISNTPAQQKEMLGVIGAGSHRGSAGPHPGQGAAVAARSTCRRAMAETDLIRHLRALAARNADADDYACFLGAGSYDHSSRARSTT